MKPIYFWPLGGTIPPFITIVGGRGMGKVGGKQILIVAVYAKPTLQKNTVLFVDRAVELLRFTCFSYISDVHSWIFIIKNIQSYTYIMIYIYIICSITEIDGLSFQALSNHCFPSIRPYFKPLFLSEVVRFRGPLWSEKSKALWLGGVTFQPLAARRNCPF